MAFSLANVPFIITFGRLKWVEYDGWLFGRIYDARELLHLIDSCMLLLPYSLPPSTSRYHVVLDEFVHLQYESFEALEAASMN